MLYLWILKVVKHLILIDNFSSLQIKYSQEEKINILLYQILVFTVHGKILKSNIRIIHLEYQLQHGMKNLNYLRDQILCEIFNIILIIY